MIRLRTPTSLILSGSYVPNGTAGSILFLDSNKLLAQDNANLFWDDTNNRLGVGTTGPVSPLHVRTSTQTQLILERTSSTPVGMRLKLGSVEWDFHVESTGEWALFNLGAVGVSNYTILAKTSNAIGFGHVSPTATLHPVAGSTAANSAPLKFNSGTLMTTAEVGAFEFLTDKLYFTITTGATRKEITINDAALTPGWVPYVVTNGRIYGDDDLTFNSGTNTLSATNVTSTGTIDTAILTAGTVTLSNTLTLAVGSTTVAPLKFRSGSLLTTPVAGVAEFLTDKAYLTITTGTARKEFALADIALTSGRVPFMTTNGRLTDSANFTCDGTNATIAGNFTVGGNINNNTGNVTVNDNLDVTGNVSVTGVVTATSYIDSGSHFQVNGTQVVGTRKTGWTAATGTATRTSFATSTVTTSELAERVKGLLDDLLSHGLIGA